MSDAAKAEYQVIAAALGAEAAGRSHGVIVALSEARVRAQTIAKQVNAFDQASLGDPKALRRFDKLCAMAYRESSLIGQLLTTLRLTPQRRYSPDTAHRRATDPRASAKPWETIK
jgi:hypothetical protein